MSDDRQCSNATVWFLVKQTKHLMKINPISCKQKEKNASVSSMTFCYEFSIGTLCSKWRNKNRTAQPNCQIFRELNVHIRLSRSVNAKKYNIVNVLPQKYCLIDWLPNLSVQPKDQLHWRLAHRCQKYDYGLNTASEAAKKWKHYPPVFPSNCIPCLDHWPSGCRWTW